MTCYAKAFRHCVIRAFEQAFLTHEEEDTLRRIVCLVTEEMEEVSIALAIELDKIKNGEKVSIKRFLQENMYDRPFLSQYIYDEQVILNACRTFEEKTMGGPFVTYRIGHYRVKRYLEKKIVSVYNTSGRLILCSKAVDYLGNVIKVSDTQYLYVGEDVVYLFRLFAGDKFRGHGDQVVYGQNYIYLLERCVAFPVERFPSDINPYCFLEQNIQNTSMYKSFDPTTIYDAYDGFLMNRVVNRTGLVEEIIEEKEEIIEEKEEIIIEDEEIVIEDEEIVIEEEEIVIEEEEIVIEEEEIIIEEEIVIEDEIVI